MKKNQRVTVSVRKRAGFVRLAGEPAAKFALKYLKMCEREQGATMRDFLKVSSELTADQVRYLIVGLRRIGKIRMTGARSASVYVARRALARQRITQRPKRGTKGRSRPRCRACSIPPRPILGLRHF
jgi:hypothetical protein